MIPPLLLASIIPIPKYSSQLEWFNLTQKLLSGTGMTVYGNWLNKLNLNPCQWQIWCHHSMARNCHLCHYVQIMIIMKEKWKSTKKNESRLSQYVPVLGLLIFDMIAVINFLGASTDKGKSFLLIKFICWLMDLVCMWWFFIGYETRRTARDGIWDSPVLRKLLSWSMIGIPIA